MQSRFRYDSSSVVFLAICRLNLSSLSILVLSCDLDATFSRSIAFTEGNPCTLTISYTSQSKTERDQNVRLEIAFDNVYIWYNGRKCLYI
jgi:hypothetical protein